MPKGKPYPAEFKSKIVLEALAGNKTITEIAEEHSINANLIRRWKAVVEDNMFKLFSAEDDARTLELERAQHQEEVDNLNRLLGKACAERDYLQRRVLAKPKSRCHKTLGVSSQQKLPFPLQDSVSFCTSSSQAITQTQKVW